MELSPLIWQKIQRESCGLAISLPLSRDGAGWCSEFTGQRFEVLGYHAAGGLRVTLHCWNINVIKDDETVVLTPLPHSSVEINPICSPMDFFKSAEVCAGMGGTSYGALWAGIVSEVVMDRSELACSLLKANGHQKVICGDISIPRDVASFHHALNGNKVGLLAGFPCQPFSRLGRALGFGDLRAATFFRVLDTAALIDCSWLVLECVMGAGDHKEVHLAMDQYCRLRGHHWTSIGLHLDRTLPSYRTRWWAVAVPLWIPLPALRDLPFAADRQELRSIFPFWPCWSDAEEEELLLSHEEMAFYAQDGGADRLLQMDGRAPTLLHSLAHHMRECPCGCRAAFNVDLLMQKGIHCFLIQSQRFPGRLRHPHPNELSILVGVPHGLRGTDRLRDLLPMLGQIASPLQSHWILLQMLNTPLLRPSECLDWQHEIQVQKLLQGHYKRWPSVDMYAHRVCQLQVASEPPINFLTSQPVTIKEAVDATSQLMDTVLEVDEPNLELDELIPGDVAAVKLKYGAGDLWQELMDLESAEGTIPEGLHELTLKEQGWMLFDKASNADFAFFTPQMVAHFLESWLCPNSLVEAVHAKTDFIALQWDDGHWITVHGKKVEGGLKVIVYDGWRSCISLDTKRWILRVGVALELTCSFELRTEFQQSEGPHCGTVALLHMGLVLGLWARIDDGTASLWYEVLRKRQLRYGCGPSREQAVIQMIAEILPAKGVKEANAVERARAAVRKLGLDCLEKALKSRDPSRALKSAGNAVGKPFHWIQFEELENHIQQRSQTKFNTDSKGTKRKPQGKRVDPSIELCPETLELLPGTFEDDHEESLAMITLENIKPDMRGVAIVTQEQAASYLKDGRNLSTDAFALVTIGELANAPSEAKAVQWTAIYRPTMEPIIVNGHLISLGDVPVQQCEAQNKQEIPTVDSTVVRVQVFADQFLQSWDDLCRGPVKMIVQLIPALQVCRQAECPGDCRKFHEAVEENVHSVLLDVWGWRWLDSKMKQVKAPHAAIFSVQLRIPCSGLVDLLGYSGWSGIFIEPRPADNDGAPRFSVIWLGKHHTMEDAAKLKRTEEKVIGLARMGDKLGVRVLAKNEMATMRLIFPNRPLVACEIKKRFEVGPFPHNLAKDQILKILQDWHWSARPLRPLRSSPGGKYWEIGTDADPPGPFLYTDGGAISITKKRDIADNPKKAQLFMAAGNTTAHIKSSNAYSSSSSSSKATDPWLHGADPWAAYKNKSEASTVPVFPANKAKGDAPQTRLAEIEARIVQQCEEKIQAAKLDKPSAEEDVDMQDEAHQKLQSQVMELKAQNDKFEGWFTETGQRMGAVEQHVQQQNRQIMELGTALKTQANTTAHIQQEVGALKASFRADLAEEMEKQSSRLEALLEKRARS